MGHNYKNYAHLEGVVNEDAVVIPTHDGDMVTFSLAVREATRNFNGDIVSTPRCSTWRWVAGTPGLSALSKKARP